MKKHLKSLALCIASASLLTIHGCGGGGSASSTPAATGGTTTALSVSVIDGPIQNAVVCLDKNGNGVCDSGEPTGKTDGTGKATLAIDNADAGKYAIVAVVGTDAIDTDRPNTPITVPFTLKAPADKPAVVSPLTTLVQSLVETSGVTSATAEAQIKEQSGITVSLFEDFTKGTTAGSQNAGAIARMLVVTTQQQSVAIKSTVGSTAIDGTTVKVSDIDKIVQAKLVEILSAIIAALSDPTVLAATTPAAKEAAIQAQAIALLSSPSNSLTTMSVATLVAVTNAVAAPSTAAEAPVAGISLAGLNYASASNWFSRMYTASAAQNTPDANGLVRYVERRSSSANGAVAVWGAGAEPRRNSDLNFNGTTWANCPLNFENTSTVRDAKGNSDYTYCNSETGTSNRASFDIGGKTMASVYQQIRDGGYTNLNIADTSVLGSATFPAGSLLRYQASTTFKTANSYYPGTSNFVGVYSAAVAAGGVSSAQASGVACNSVEYQSGASSSVANLEAMTVASPGTPCVFNSSASFTYFGSTYYSPDIENTSWANSTLSLGKLGIAPTNSGVAPGYYSGNTPLRVAFKGVGNNPVTYYACKERFNNGSPVNCAVVGTGTYTITSQGDARTLSLNNLPAAAAPLGYQRVFVERGGKVFFGYKYNLTVVNRARFDKVATTALFSQLGLPAPQTDTPQALTFASYAGDWNLVETASPSQSTLLRIFSNGTVACSNTDARVSPPVTTNFSCTLVANNLATGAFTLTNTDGSGQGTGTLNFLTGTASGNILPTAGGSFSFTGGRR